MPLKIKCSNAACDKILVVPDELVGRSVKCPSCMSRTLVPVPPGNASTSHLVRVKCSNEACDKILVVKDEMIGKTVKCPSCRSRTVVPAGSPKPRGPDGARSPAAKKASPKQAAPLTGKVSAPPSTAKSAPSKPAAPSRKPPAPDPADEEYDVVEETPEKEPAPVEEEFDIMEEVSEEKPAASKKAGKPSPAPADEPSDIMEEVPEEKPAASKKADKKAESLEVVDELELADEGETPSPLPLSPAAGERGRGEGSVARPTRPQKPVEKHAEGGDGEASDEPPDDLWEKSPLLQRNCIMSKKHMLSMSGAKWTLTDPETKETVGMAREPVPMWKLLLRHIEVGPIKFKSWLSTVVELREKDDGPVLFTVRKLANMFSLVSTVEIYDFKNEMIGYFKAKIFSLFGGFWLYDAEDQQAAEVKVELGKWARFRFLAPDGRELGDLRPEGYGKTVAFISGNTGLMVSLADEMKDQMQLKVLLLAAALAMDLTGTCDKILNPMKH